MINAGLGTIIENKLNSYYVEDGNDVFGFYIHNNEGEYLDALSGTQKVLPKKLINGVLLNQSSTPVPLAGLNSVLLMQSLELIIPVHRGWRVGSKQTGGIDYIMGTLNNFVQDCAGMTGSISDENGKSYSYALSVSTPNVGAVNYYGEIGKVIPVTMQVSWQIVENGVLSNDVKIKLDGTPVVLMDGAIARVRTGDASNVDGSREMQTAITQQGLTFTIVIPYKEDGVSAVLMEDMLNGVLNKQYTLEYQDPIINHSWEVVARSITSSLTAQKSISIVAIFEIARDFEEVEGD